MTLAQNPYSEACSTFPESLRALIREVEAHDRFDRLEAVLPRHRETQRCALRFRYGLAVGASDQEREFVRCFRNRKPLDVGPRVPGRRAVPAPLRDRETFPSAGTSPSQAAVRARPTWRAEIRSTGSPSTKPRHSGGDRDVLPAASWSADRRDRSRKAWRPSRRSSRSTAAASALAPRARSPLRCRTHRSCCRSC